MTETEFRAAVREVFPMHRGDCWQVGMSDEWNAEIRGDGMSVCITCRPSHTKYRWKVGTTDAVNYGRNLSEAVEAFRNNLRTIMMNVARVSCLICAAKQQG